MFNLLSKCTKTISNDVYVIIIIVMYYFGSGIILRFIKKKKKIVEYICMYVILE